MRRRVWALRVAAVVIAGGGSWLSGPVLDAGMLEASTVLAVSSVLVGMYLGHLSTKIKPRPVGPAGESRRTP